MKETSQYILETEYMKHFISINESQSRLIILKEFKII